MASDNESTAIVQAERLHSPVTIEYKRRRLAMCYVFEHELSTLGSANSKTSLDVGLFGLSVGALIAFGITVLTVEIANPFIYATFWALATASLLFSFFFGIRFIISRRESAREVTRILEESKNRDPDVLI